MLVPVAKKYSCRISFSKGFLLSWDLTRSLVGLNLLFTINEFVFYGDRINEARFGKCSNFLKFELLLLFFFGFRSPTLFLLFTFFVSFSIIFPFSDLGEAPTFEGKIDSPSIIAFFSKVKVKSEFGFVSLGLFMIFVLLGTYFKLIGLLHSAREFCLDFLKPALSSFLSVELM